MARQNDKISKLIPVRYFSWIREAILEHGNVNIQALSDKFNILAGNTYFRNFIKDKNQDYLGISGLTSILDTCGYTLKLVPVKKEDLNDQQMINDLTRESFEEIRLIISNYAKEFKRAPKVEKVKKDRVIENSSLIFNSLMGEINTLDDDDELIIGTDMLILDPDKMD